MHALLRNRVFSNQVLSVYVYMLNFYTNLLLTKFVTETLLLIKYSF